MNLILRFISWGTNFEGSTRSAGLIRIGLVLLIWARYGYVLLPLHVQCSLPFLFRVVFFLSTLLMAVGFLSRGACAASALCLGMTYFYYGHFLGDSAWIAHHMYLLVVATFLMIFTACGKSYSFDRWWALRQAKRHHAVPPHEWGDLLGLRLIAVQIVAIYFWGAVGKMTPAFLSGERFQHYLYDFYSGVDWQNFPGFVTFCAIAGSGVAFFEVALAVGLLTPRFRTFFIPVGIVFHLLIYVFLPVLTFSLTMILLYLVFIPAREVHTWLDRMQGFDPESKARPVSQY